MINEYHGVQFGDNDHVFLKKKALNLLHEKFIK